MWNLCWVNLIGLPSNNAEKTSGWWWCTSCITTWFISLPIHTYLRWLDPQELFTHKFTMYPISEQNATDGPCSGQVIASNIFPVITGSLPSTSTDTASKLMDCFSMHYVNNPLCTWLLWHTHITTNSLQQPSRLKEADSRGGRRRSFTLSMLSTATTRSCSLPTYQHPV